ncbi:ABC transporter ATP-binding protein [Alteromonas sediminis]|uniref:ABC transporter ATP-binding protein n=1 Tax=Alteromonas sediminis TaxID=2259342 RepID=A0A3N5Y3L8_9ALTE|nr:ABC transporter ATP-binding protein [Alteromonas sediminis]RPJ68532.1 ABC transporter ATP-binding protein [Alteromonas sediminis]
MLTVTSLSKQYDNGVKALNNIELQIGKGMFGLLGPNGAGKSSLMRTLATIQAPDSGYIQFNDINVLNRPHALRRVLGYLPQEFGVYPRVSAFRLLDYLAVLKGIHNKNVRHKKVNELLEQTNLLNHKHKSVATFSGGMVRRFGIAQALIASPELIVVDEPTAGLDPQERNRFYSLLSEVSENATLILSSHIIEDIEGLCSNLAIINNGKVVNQGGISSLSNVLGGKVWQAQTNEQQVSQWQKVFSFLSVKSIGAERFVRVLADIPPTPDFYAVPPNLEDVYFAALANQGQEAK